MDTAPVVIDHQTHEACGDTAGAEIFMRRRLENLKNMEDAWIKAFAEEGLKPNIAYIRRLKNRIQRLEDRLEKKCHT